MANDKALKIQIIIGSTRAIEQLRQVVIELRMHPIKNAIHPPSTFSRP